MKAKQTLIAFLLALCMSFMNIQAQDSQPNTGVFVTTQDFSSLRQGPGRAFNRIAVIPPTTTLPAIGRTSDTQWIQVVYEGQSGWIASILLVWSGDIINLPVDGVNPYPFVRRAAALGITTRQAPVYASHIETTPIMTIPAGETIELTGRLGESGYIRFQIRYQNQLVWIGSWNVHITDGDYRRLLDLAYLYPYGRLVLELEENLAFSLTSYRQILSVWSRLNSGEQVRCAPIPPLVNRTMTEGDVAKEPSFLPSVIALDNAINAINSAIKAFEDACATAGFVLTSDYVRTQLSLLADAERNLIIVGSLLEPLRARNPLLDNQR